MKIYLHKNFLKQFSKLKEVHKLKVDERLRLFIVNPFDSALNNHALKGKYTGYRSINMTGDLRALYYKFNKDKYKFMVLDTHSNLYD